MEYYVKAHGGNGKLMLANGHSMKPHTGRCAILFPHGVLFRNEETAMNAYCDEIVRLLPFPNWQNTKAGEREIQKALRKIIYVKYKVKDQELFDKAFGYIRQYY